MKITVVGSGYVGLSLSVLLSQKHEVVALDISKKTVELINKRISPFKDENIESFFSNQKLNLRATLNKVEAFENCEYAIIATPTNFNLDTENFDTSYSWRK